MGMSSNFYGWRCFKSGMDLRTSKVYTSFLYTSSRNRNIIGIIIRSRIRNRNRGRDDNQIWNLFRINIKWNFNQKWNQNWINSFFNIKSNSKFERNKFWTQTSIPISSRWKSWFCVCFFFWNYPSSFQMWRWSMVSLFF